MQNLSSSSWSHTGFVVFRRSCFEGIHRRCCLNCKIFTCDFFYIQAYYGNFQSGNQLELHLRVPPRTGLTRTMAITCCVVGCGKISSARSGISFHRFPLNAYRAKKWLRILRLRGTFKYLKARVCSNHFSSHQYRENGK